MPGYMSGRQSLQRSPKGRQMLFGFTLNARGRRSWTRHFAATQIFDFFKNCGHQGSG